MNSFETLPRPAGRPYNASTITRLAPRGIKNRMALDETPVETWPANFIEWLLNHDAIVRCTREPARYGAYIWTRQGKRARADLKRIYTA